MIRRLLLTVSLVIASIPSPASLGEYLGAGSTKSIGIYHMNGNVNDSSGNGNNATGIGLMYVSGKFNSAVNYNSYGNYCRVASLSSTAQTYTFSFWVKSNDDLATAYEYLSDSQTGRLTIAWNGTSAGHMGYYDGAWHVLTSAAPNDGNWHNLIFTFGSSTMNYYLDGAFKETGSYSAKNLSGNFGIGNSYDGTGAQWWPKQEIIDEVILDGFVWTPAQIKKYYTFTKGRYGNL